MFRIMGFIKSWFLLIFLFVSFSLLLFWLMLEKMRIVKVFEYISTVDDDF